MKYQLRNLNETFKMGEWIDSESYIRNDDKLLLFQLMYRTEGNVPPLHKATYNQVLGAYNYYIEWRNSLYDSYSDLFEGGDDNDAEHRRKFKERYGLVDDEEYQEQNKENKEWERTYGWYQVLFNVFAGGDYLKMSKAYNLKVIEVMNHLTYLKSKK